MNRKLTALLAGAALLAGVGTANAAQMPEIMGSAAYQPMADQELAQVKGAVLATGGFIAHALAKGLYASTVTTGFVVTIAVKL
jgi:hypothetical protein